MRRRRIVRENYWPGLLRSHGCDGPTSGLCLEESRVDEDVGLTPVLLNTCTGMVISRSTATEIAPIDVAGRPRPPNLKASSSHFGDDDRDIVAAPVRKGSLDQVVNDGCNVAFRRHGVRDLLAGKLVE
jgi:hypothetical protein